MKPGAATGFHASVSIIRLHPPQLAGSICNSLTPSRIAFISLISCGIVSLWRRSEIPSATIDRIIFPLAPKTGTARTVTPEM